MSKIFHAEHIGRLTLNSAGADLMGNALGRLKDTYQIDKPDK